MLPLFLAASLAFTSADAHLAYETADRLVRDHTPRDAGTVRGQLAANFILDAASAAGADVRRDRFTARTPRGERLFTNLTAEFRAGSEAPWVVVVSHYDTKTGTKCPGANDGASTSGLLVGLANALASWKTPRGNVMLVWTDGEECMDFYGPDDGLWGSRRAAKSLSEKGMEVRAVICVDMLGDRDLNVSLPRNSSPDLVALALRAAKKAGAGKKIGKSGCLVTDDHVPFIEAGYPAIDLIDFEYGSKPGLNDYWHTEKDTMDKISEESLRTAGEVVVQMLEELL